MRKNTTIFDYSKETFKKRIGFKIRSIRRRKGLTQLQLSKLSGVERTYLVHIEGGKQSMGLYTFYKIRKALKVSYLKLLL